MASQNELIQDFITSSREHLDQMEPDLLALEESGDHPDKETVNRIFRSVHSIKGASGFMDLKNINRLSHVMESVLMKIRDGELKPNSPMIDALLGGADRLSAMIDDIEGSEALDIQNEMDRIESFLSSSAATPADNETAEATTSASDHLIPTPETLQYAKDHGQYLFNIQIDLQKNLAEQGLPELIEQIGTLGAVHQQGPLNLLVSTILEEDLLADSLNIPQNQVKRLSLDEEPAATQQSETEVKPVTSSPVEETATKDAGQTSSAAVAAREENLRVKVSLLNRMMNMAGELVLSRNQLMQILASYSNEIQGLNTALQNLNLVTTELQENIMQTRMQPIGSVFNKLPRLIRDLSHRLKKNIEMELEGSEVELDKSIIESLADPLTHLVRNTADHGIESPEQRKAADKDPIGRVVVKAYHEAGNVNIDIIDDGRGLDREAILRKALEKNLITQQEAERLTDREIFAFIFAPGFSTAAKVTDVSGRGVGMDVVKTNIEKMGGMIELESEAGKGTRVNLRLPLTLAIIPSLIVFAGKEKFAIPQVSIEELVRLRAGDVHKTIERVNQADVIRLRDKLLPLVRIADVLGIEKTAYDPVAGEMITERRQSLADRRAKGRGQCYVTGEGGQLVPLTEDKAAENDERRDSQKTSRRWRRESGVTIVVLRAGNNRYGLVVTSIQDSEEIVVKPLSKYIKHNIAYSGATIMGDGSVALILDAHGLAESAGLRFEELDQTNKNMQQEFTAQQMREKQPIILFHNGPDEPFGLSLSLITRIEKIRTSEIERVGEKEFIQYRGGALRIYRLDKTLNVSKPTTIPEFLHVIVPKTLRAPAGIVATEVVDVKEIDVKLDRTNVKTPGILGSSIIDGRLSLMLDVFGFLELADPEMHAKEKESYSAKGDQHLLLVEDTPFFQTLEKSYLESAGYQVDLAVDGVDALKYLQQKKYDLVVCDIEMPRMNGYELVRQLRSTQQWRKLPVVAVTALADQESQKKAKDAGFTDYEIKIDKDHLLAKLSKLLNAEA